jgi:hypothetical protein
MNLKAKIGLGAAALLLAVGGGAALAHPHPDADHDGKTVERAVIIHSDGKGEHAAAGDRRVRRFEVHRIGMEDCAGGDKIVDESSADGDKKTKVIVCTIGQPSAATAEHLEGALARIAANDDLSAEQKARIESAIRSAIDRARSAR